MELTRRRKGMPSNGVKSAAARLCRSLRLWHKPPWGSQAMRGDQVRSRRIWIGLAGVSLLAATAAGAGVGAGGDVKAGADAWSRGDYAGAVANWQAPAAAGDPDAEFNLGQAYRLGRGVTRDLGRAEELFGKAAAQGHVQAADNYGLLMFDRGARAQAMPYVRAAADRGDPRAQYLVAIAHFNGDLAPKDWVRAYALMSLAQSAGLPQAAPAIRQMDGFIPLEQRQQAAGLAQQIAQQSDTARATQIAASDLTPAPASPVPGQVAAPVPPAPAPRSDSGAATAGADYARPAGAVPPPLAAPATRPTSSSAPKPAPASRPVVARAAPPPAPKPASAAPKPAAPAPRAVSGAWRVQLGAFGVPANADALWAKVAGRPELAGHARISVRAGKVTKLQAGGFASQGQAATACAGLARAGFPCIPAQD